MKFDEFINKEEIIDKYSEVRDYFAKAQTHKELAKAKEDLHSAIKYGEVKKTPSDIIQMFFNERTKQLGPYIEVKDEIRHSPAALSANVQKALTSQISNQRPTWA
jgi:hypothetical protein